MRKWITFLMTALVGTSISYANANFGQVNFEAGYRSDNITFNHEFRDEDVGLKSKFEDLDIFQLGLQARTTLGCNFYLRGSAYFGWILDGDFKEVARTNSFYGASNYGGGCGFTSNNRNTIDDRYVYGIAAAIGYPFYFCDCSMALAPVIGYSYDQQNIRLDGSVTTLYRSDYGIGACRDDCCCTHKFTNRWYGPFVGVDFLYRPYGGCWDLYADLEYHWGNNSARRGLSDYNDGDHRNLTSHNARAWVFAAGADYAFDDCWTAGVSVKFQDWRAHKNRHYRYNDEYAGSSSGEDTRIKHSSKWRSYAVNFTVGRDF